MDWVDFISWKPRVQAGPRSVAADHLAESQQVITAQAVVNHHPAAGRLDTEPPSALERR